MKSALLFIYLTVTILVCGQTATAPSSGDGTEGNPYQIATWQNLYWIAATDAVVPSPSSAARLSAYYTQTADITFPAEINTWNGGQGWIPIGVSGTNFTGNYDGNNYKISGLYINADSGNKGLFRIIGSGGSVKNLGVINMSITIYGGSYYYSVGGLSGGNNGTIENCYTTGSITSASMCYYFGGLTGSNSAGSTVLNSYSSVNISSYMYVGGLTGWSGGTITDSYSTGNVSGTQHSVGGFIGYNETGGSITKCYSTGEVTSSGCGGFVGSNYGNISKSLSLGNVTSTVGGSGGFVAVNYGNITDCYSKGNVTSISPNGGAFVSWFDSGIISNCYSTGSVSFSNAANPTDRGFAGYKRNSGNAPFPSFNDCFWDEETSGQSTSIGEAVGEIDGKTTEEMKTQSTFSDAGWNFLADTGDWAIHFLKNDGYPYLQWQNLQTIIETPSAQPTKLLFSNEVNTTPDPDENNIIISYTASATAEKYIVIRNLGSEPTFTPSDGTEYTTGAQTGGYVVYSGNELSAEDENVSDGNYYYKVFAFNGSDADTKYLTTDPLSGNTIVSSDGETSLGDSDGDPSGASFPNAGVTITFPNGTSGTNLSVSKTASAPESNFAALPGVRGLKNLYFTITSTNATPGTYTLILDFSSLVISDWTKFKILKRANETEAWKDVTQSPINAVIENRQTDGVWGKFTISGLTSFSEFGGGEEAAVLTVTSLEDDPLDASTLRGKIADAVAGDIITFDNLLAGQTIALDPVEGSLIINKSLTIRGPEGGISIDADNQSRVITNTMPTANIRLENLIIKNGDDSMEENLVGGIYLGGNLTMVNCVVSDNNCSGSLAIGGIYQAAELSAQLVLINCTITGNSGDPTDGTGGISSGSKEYIYNTIIYGNTGGLYSDVDEDISLYEVYNSCIGNLNNLTISDGANNISSNPLFVGAGNSPEHPFAISQDSPCADAGNNDYSTDLKDLKGDDRKVLKTDSNTPGIIDIGAYEFNSETPLPVELTSFTASISKGKVTLNWQTATETNNHGFDIERKMMVGSNSEPGDKSQWEKIGFIEGAGNSNAPKSYSFTDNSSAFSTQLSYRLKQIDNDGKYSYSKEITVELSAVPTEFSLSQNYPNPFNPTTTIEFTLPKDSDVMLKVYNILGQEVSTLVNKQMKAGYHKVKFDASSASGGLSSGIYLYKIQSGDFSAVKKLMLVK